MFGQGFYLCCCPRVAYLPTQALRVASALRESSEIPGGSEIPGMGSAKVAMGSKIYFVGLNMG